jgi:putative protease
LAYGADAVYIGGKQFGLRAFADNFNLEEMKEASDMRTKMGKKSYVTMNMFARNDDFDEMEEYVRSKAIGADAVIIFPIREFLN